MMVTDEVEPDGSVQITRWLTRGTRILTDRGLIECGKWMRREGERRCRESFLAGDGMLWFEVRTRLTKFGNEKIALFQVPEPDWEADGQRDASALN